MTSTSMPVTLIIGDQTVFSGEISIANFLLALAASSRPSAASGSHHNSYPITVDQAKQLLRKIDKKSVTFLKAIAQNEGEIAFMSICEIFGITRWAEYSGTFGKGITRALRHMTDNSSATLIWWDDKEWESENDPNGSVYIDGQALKSLQAAIGSTAD